MRILVINPNSSSALTESVAEAAQQVVAPGTIISATNPSRGPAVIEGSYDEVLATFHLLEEVERAERENPPDAYVIACFGDPGLDAVKELTDRPVVGVAEAAIHMSSFVAATFSVVSILPRVRKHLHDLVRQAGATNRLASIKLPNLGVMAFHEDEHAALETLKQAAKEAVQEDGAESIVLGCAGMVGFARQLSDELGVPVIDPVEAACRVAESLVALGYQTSKANSYQKPTEKQYL
ncbi:MULTISPECIES: aspartate/glutamate racemase family protein [unclassified Arthrobacter]|uniref:aspartate/glutamate racemase family protein n=1 Tax=unclassified Arthrobacter TaxID=235627 RepID=UPI0015E4780B|nr:MULTISPECIES: aspartate/glutamate racemase family protein [unclassified Arthrobacter]